MRSRLTLALVSALTVLLASVPAAGQGKAEQELIQVEKDWCTAYLKRDQALLTRILADDFLGVTQQGATETKAQVLATFPDTSSSTTACVDTDFKVRVYGDTGIVTARASRSGTEKGAPYKDRTFMYTDTFVRRDGRWQCVASQSTLTAPAPR